MQRVADIRMAAKKTATQGRNESKDPLQSLARIKVLIDKHYEVAGRTGVETSSDQRETLEEIEDEIKSIEIPPGYIMDEKMREHY